MRKLNKAERGLIKLRASTMTDGQLRRTWIKARKDAQIANATCDQWRRAWQRRQRANQAEGQTTD